MASSLTSKTPVSSKPVEPTTPAPSASVETRQTRIASLRLEASERSADGSNAWRVIRPLLIVAVLGGGGYAVYAAAGGGSVAGALSNLRERATSLWNSSAESAGAGAAVVEVDAYRIPEAASDEVFLSLAGFIVPATEVRVGPRVPGTIVEVPVEQGSRVTKGDLLAQIESVSYFAELEQAKAALGLAEANLLELENGSLPEEIADAEAAVEEARVQFLLKQKERDRMIRLKSGRNVVSEQESDIVEAEFKRLEAQVNSLEQKLKLVKNGPRPERIAAAKAKVAEANALVTKAAYFYENAGIVSPIDGTVLEKQTEVGEIVRPDVLLSDMFLLADLNHLQAEVDVQERDLHRIQVGDPCRIIPDAYPDRRYAGRMQKIRPQINRQRAVVGVEVAVLEPDEHLLPNMNCRVEFLTPIDANASSAVRIPSSALVQTETESSVYFLDGATVKRCPVTPGKTDGPWVEITAGLKPGDVVLLPGETSLQDGQSVTARFATAETSAKP